MSALFKIKDHSKETKLFINRTIASASFVAFLFFILLARVFYLQIAQHDNYLNMAQNNQIRVISIPPIRGLIYDRNGILIAENSANYSLEIVPNRVTNFNKLFKELNDIIPISEKDEKEFYKQIKLKGRFESIPIKSRLTEKEVATFALEQHRFTNVEVNAYLSRKYPYSELFAHVLGYIGRISENDLENIDITKYRGTHVIGRSGLESYYESLLHGTAGFEKVETDARGKIVRKLEETLPTPGKNLYLTIDSRLQQIAYDALAGKRGAVVAIEIDTGEVLTLASRPSYDANLFISGINQQTYNKLQNQESQPLFHRAIRGQYPPGSTVKPLIGLKALEEDILTPNFTLFDPGYYKLSSESRLFRDWQKNGHGHVNLESAIAQSCSTFFYYLSEKLGIDHIYDIYSQFGLGKLTNIDLYGEAQGLAPNDEWKRIHKKQSWFVGETLITGIGQGYTLATPIQMAQVAATLGAKGKRMQPYLVKKMHLTGKPEEITQTIEAQNIEIKNLRNWNTVVSGMQKSITDNRGTAHRIFDKRKTYDIAGKTGTVQVFGLKQDEFYEVEKIKEDLRDHGWFIAFAPVKQPKIALAVIVENSKGSSEIAKKVLDAYFKGQING